MRSFVSVAFDAAKEQSFYDPLKPHTAHLGLAITLPRPRSCRAQVRLAGSGLISRRESDVQGWGLRSGV